MRSMTESFQERRRGSRAATSELEVMVPTSITVQVLDISLGGVLLASSTDLPVGHRAGLRMVLGSEPCAVQVEIRHGANLGEAHGEGRYRLGAAFVALDEECRRSIHRFLKNEAP